MAKPNKVDANPTKAFFVRMITRDIALEDCVLDLIDNSIDGAWKLEGGKPMSLSDKVDLSQYKISIQATADKFSIIDNCGGITLDDAVEYAFAFGRKEKDEPDKYSIGVYGIGMKRAVFKIGRKISIRSTFPAGGKKRETFQVPIDVTAWLADAGRDWDFNIEPAEPLASNGVEILVEDLTEETSASFGNSGFIQDLKRTIGRDYSLHIRRGLVIEINGERIKGWTIELLQSGQLEPMRLQYIDKDSGGEVAVEILAGMAAPPPENSDPDENAETDKRYGWYVVCNGRIVLAADKTEVSGWGTDGWPQWHPQYAGFVGIIVFSSENASLLPLTTTKRSVDSASAVYRRARPKMRDASKEWIKYTNIRKQGLEAAKQFEVQAKPKSIFEVTRRETLIFPSVTPKPKVKSANISYPMPQERVTSLANALGSVTMTYRDVGIKSFEYAYNDLVGEE